MTSILVEATSTPAMADVRKNDTADDGCMIVSKADAMNPTYRATMEDRCVIHSAGTWGASDKDLAFFGVYDGHGGREIVDFLEHAMSYHVAQELNEVDDTLTMQTRLERAFLLTDVHARMAGVVTSGATVALSLIKRNDDNTIDLVTANAGDSRVVLYHDGTVERLSTDHKLTDRLEVERIQKQGGFVFRGRVAGVLALTRSLGDHLLKRFIISHPHVRQERINLNSRDKTDFVIVACDGLFDVMTDEYAANVVKACGMKDQHEDAASHLVKEALRRKTTDNVSAIVVWF